jgi:hypothetical protein
MGRGGEVQPDSISEVAALGRMLIGARPEGAIGWSRIVDLARQCSVSPFLFQAICGWGGIVPHDIRQELHQDAYRATARLALQDEELARVLSVLDSAGVPAVLLKGAAFNRTLYPDAASRLMGDIDLWIQRHHLGPARQALGSLGYHALSKATRPLPLQDAYLGETQLVSPMPGTGLLELHWNAFPGEWIRTTAAIDEHAVWARAVPIDGISANQLAPEDAVLQTCVHFAVTHQMRGLGLRPLLDLAMMRRIWGIDWMLVVERARAWRLKTVTWFVLQLMTWVFGCDGQTLPLDLLCPASGRQKLLHSLAAPKGVVAGSRLRTELERRVFLLLLVDRPGDAPRLLWRALFPGDEWLRLRYGLEDSSRWRLWLQRVWHPVRTALHTDV